MKRTILAVTAAALLASATFAIAQPGMKAGGWQPPTEQQRAENASAMADARIAALKAGLRLTSDQDKLWPALETALQDFSKEQFNWREQRREQREAMRGPRGPGAPGAGPDVAGGPPAGPGPDAGPAPEADAGPGGPGRPGGPERDIVAQVEQRASRMIEQGTALKQLADAAKPLYATLDPGQRHRFNVLFRQAQFEAFGGPHHKGGPREGHPGQRFGMMHPHGDPRHGGPAGGPAGGPGLPPPAAGAEPL
ncbi:hypothetical protein FHS55_003064 [Angulomicrobium tetraedrale]|uniref:LTXXQ motif family protein n=1 Tax=Ancylobacter tetraedralis TaxID=217068 RepID=A0A839ZCS0_9HYPH|nr:Spy/CpxP family protein refolding chaperone [Ancylobacter tetraedralis]MBB3772452.1 hypothetical protein [Ancylobacter tetraedralis]